MTTHFTKTNPAPYSREPRTWTSPDGRYEIQQIVGQARPFQVIRVRKPLFGDATRTFVDSFTTLQAAKDFVRGTKSREAKAALWGWVTSTGSDRKAPLTVEEIKQARRDHWVRAFSGQRVTL